MQTPAEYLNFDRVAEAYNASRYIPPDVLRRCARIIAADTGPSPRGIFLDAGVGTGRFAAPLAAEGLEVAGVDISIEMLRQARACGSRLGLVRADLRSLPFLRGSFTGAMAFHILHLIVDWREVVRELRRTLKPGASLYLGLEEGKRLRTRSLYFQIAQEWGLTRPNLGTPTFAACTEYLQETGAIIERIDQDRLHWTATVRVGDLLDTLKSNSYSHMWHVEPEVHSLLYTELEQRLDELKVERCEVEEAPAHIALWRARWPREERRQP